MTGSEASLPQTDSDPTTVGKAGSRDSTVRKVGSDEEPHGDPVTLRSRETVTVTGPGVHRKGRHCHRRPGPVSPSREPLSPLAVLNLARWEQHPQRLLMAARALAGKPPPSMAGAANPSGCGPQELRKTAARRQRRLPARRPGDWGVGCPHALVRIRAMRPGGAPRAARRKRRARPRRAFLRGRTRRQAQPAPRHVALATPKRRPLRGGQARGWREGTRRLCRRGRPASRVPGRQPGAQSPRSGPELRGAPRAPRLSREEFNSGRKCRHSGARGFSQSAAGQEEEAGRGLRGRRPSPRELRGTAAGRRQQPRPQTL